MNEIHIMQEIRHPNIVSLHKYYQDEDQDVFWLVMDYYPWETLNSFVKDLKEKLLITNIKTIMTQLIDVLCYLHQKKLCHRDFTMDNILICPQNFAIKLIDFGVAKYLVNFEDFLFSPVGRIKFRAPELHDYGSYNLQYDIWQCGLIFAELVMQKKFCSKKLPQQLEEEKLEEYISFLGKDLLLKMLTKEPTERCDCFQAKFHKWFFEDIE